jgi:hypothetical protein
MNTHFRGIAMSECTFVPNVEVFILRSLRARLRKARRVLEV